MRRFPIRKPILQAGLHRGGVNGSQPSSGQGPMLGSGRHVGARARVLQEQPPVVALGLADDSVESHGRHRHAREEILVDHLLDPRRPRDASLRDDRRAVRGDTGQPVGGAFPFQLEEFNLLGRGRLRRQSPPGSNGPVLGQVGRKRFFA